MELAAQRLSGFHDRYEYVSWYPDDGAWPDTLGGPFDAAVSFLAIHHLQNERKGRLAREICVRLKPGGVFADFDLFRNPGSVFEQTKPQQVHDATCATLDEMRQFLGDAGLVDVSVTAQAVRRAHQGEMALISGRKRT
jgi:hypothetical protein